ncbi:AP-5 complex subunit mu-1 isoform X2 [Hypanus sabinus]|uniref:AP-5 complex subunit mu-1 isoform X2 n=1 Tax=Hypanus sabinus TaxID=79690 RepID=UPI0028C4140F|nr:AP-5 complex subunit mu-1 isoform X2 [Hypanus sabinus]
MSVRALWLVGLERGEAASVKFSRQYPTVEKRAKVFNGDSYTEVPEDDIFLGALLCELGMTDLDKNFVELRDSCCRINRTSIYEIAVGDGTLWPVLVMTQNGILFACLPLVEQPLNPHPPLINLHGISAAFALLMGLMAFLNVSQRTESDIATKVVQLPAMLMHACPLGTPTDTDFGLMQTLSGSHGSHNSVQAPKQPAWKPGTYKGKPQVNVTVTEQIRSMQYGKKDVIDVWQAYGTVTCKVPIPPILGFYQMTEEKQQLKIAVNLKLHESVKNGFEYCEAHIPFFNRGPIIHTDCKVNHGQLEVAREKSLLVWIIGQKFPKSLEVSLTGTVIFHGVGATNQPMQPTDPFCIGLTAYVKLYFRIPDYTLTGCYADQHSVQVYSSAKPKIVTSKELLSSEYYIWNSKGDAPIASRSLLS